VVVERIQPDGGCGPPALGSGGGVRGVVSGAPSGRAGGVSVGHGGPAGSSSVGVAARTLVKDGLVAGSGVRGGWIWWREYKARASAVVLLGPGSGVVGISG
jgi:hypothetical protein